MHAVLGFLPGFEGNTLLLKMPCTLDTRLGRNILVTPRGLAFMMLEGYIFTLPKEKSEQYSYKPQQ